MFSLTRLLRRGPTSLPKTLNNLGKVENIFSLVHFEWDRRKGRGFIARKWMEILHWIVHNMDPSEPERKSPTEEAVDAHHHVHVEIPGKDFIQKSTKRSVLT